MTTETMIIDPIEAEKVAAKAETARLTKQVALYGQAAAAVERKIAQINVDELNPITSELWVLNLALERAQARVDIAEYLQIGGSEQARQFEFRAAESAALAAYRRAQATPGSPKERIEAEWSAVVHAYAASKLAIGLPRVDGTVLTSTEHEAKFYKLFVEVRRVMEQFAGLSLGERQAA